MVFWAAGLVVAALLAYAPAFNAPLEFDDFISISQNPTIRQLWPPWTALHPLANQSPVSGRPVANYSLAISYGINRLLGVDQRDDPNGPNKTVSYHLGTLTLHLLCGFLLFGVLRRTFRHQRFDDTWVAHADVAAAVIAGLWALSPIQTEAINYVVQRTEVLASLFYVATLYGSIRAWDASSARARIGWYAVASSACLLGMGSKEIMISAPLAIILYDRAFRLPSWRRLVRPGDGRGWFYLVLCATAGWLIALMTDGPRNATVGLHLGVPWYVYLYSEAWAILQYARQTFWPDRLTIDYGLNTARGLVGLPGMIVLTLFAAATIAAWVRANRWGWFAFLGSWFFMILAPSSSIVPITTEIAAERRFYLPLVSVVALVVIGADALRRRIALTSNHPRARRWWVLGVVGGLAVAYTLLAGWKADQLAHALVGPSGGAWIGIAWFIRLLVAAMAGAIGWVALIGERRRWPWAAAGVVTFLIATTFARSWTYRDSIGLWTDAANKTTSNARPSTTIGWLLLQRKRGGLDDAAAYVRRGLAVDSTYVDGWCKLGMITMFEGHFAEAQTYLEHALRLKPDDAQSLVGLGTVLVDEGDLGRAIPLLEQIVATGPNEESLTDLGTAYERSGRLDDAARELNAALALNPHREDARRELGLVLARRGRARAAGGDPRAAAADFRQSLRMDPTNIETAIALADAQAALGDRDDAIRILTRIVALRPDYRAAQTDLERIKHP